MTDKEMHKLSRRELLQLLLAQVKETDKVKQSLAEREKELTELQENYERLRKRLDQKDEKIHTLQDTLRRDRNTRRIKLQEAGSIAEAALRLNGIFDIAQKAADQYLENVRLQYEPTMPWDGYYTTMRNVGALAYRENPTEDEKFREVDWSGEGQKEVSEDRPRQPLRQKPAEPSRDRQAEPLRQRAAEPMRDRPTEPLRSRAAEPMRDRSTEPLRSRAAEPMRDRPTEPPRQRAAEPLRDRPTEPLRQQSAEPLRDQSTEPLRRRSAEPPREQPRERLREQPVERPGKAAPPPVKKVPKKVEKKTEPKWEDDFDLKEVEEYYDL